MLSVDINRATAEQISHALQIEQELAQAIVKEREVRGPFVVSRELDRVCGLSVEQRDAIQPRVITHYRREPHIVGLKMASSQPIHADEPFQIEVDFVNASDELVTMARVTVYSADLPFFWDFPISAAEAFSGRVALSFGAGATVGAGPVRFHLALFSSSGGLASSGIGSFSILPKRVLLDLKPADPADGPWIARTEQVLSVTLSTANQLALQQNFRIEICYTVSNNTGVTQQFAAREWRITAGGVPSESLLEPVSFSLAPAQIRNFVASYELDPTQLASAELLAGRAVTLDFRLFGPAASIDPSTRPLTSATLAVRAATHKFGLKLFDVGQYLGVDWTGWQKAVRYVSAIYQGINVYCPSFQAYLVAGPCCINSTEEALELFGSQPVGGVGPNVFLIADSVMINGIGATGGSLAVNGFTGGGTGINGLCAPPAVGAPSNRPTGLLVVRKDLGGALNWWATGQTMAHELGHYFGLDHVLFAGAFGTYLMAAAGHGDATAFVNGQRATVIGHCFVAYGLVL